MSDDEFEHPATPILEAADDPAISDAELGSLVRMYKGTMRPPAVIIAKPTWWEKAALVVGVVIIFVLIFGIRESMIQRDRTEGKIDTNTYVMCDMMGQLDLDVPNECPPEANR